ncbi:MAG: PD-(D/E)XK nuclease family protein, partial [Phycisphaerales bacterium JB038]
FRSANWQAQRRSAGWRIDREPEWEPEGGSVAFGGDEDGIRLTGRIDRIDRHEETNQIAILDYKTAEKALSPREVHLRRGEWRSLQLPLYRHLARAVVGEETPVLGYICLSRSERGVELKTADWAGEDLRQADAVARGVVEGVRAGRFAEVGELGYEEGALATIWRLARLASVEGVA